MNHLVTELQLLKNDLLEMMALVKSQFEKGKQAIETGDQDLADEIRSNEQRVNGLELKIDRDCENILALFQPVAIDLRFVMACFKINSDVERLGDHADSIARYILTSEAPLEKEVIDKLRLIEMYETALTMLEDVYEAFESEDTKLARKVFPKDKVMNDINSNAAHAIADIIRDNPDRIDQYLYVMTIIRKLERIGDLSKNISEEVIFYIEAKVLKHKKQQNRKDKNQSDQF